MASEVMLPGSVVPFVPAQRRAPPGKENRAPSAGSLRKGKSAEQRQSQNRFENELTTLREHLQEKDEEFQSLQRKSEHIRSTDEEGKRALERKDDEQKTQFAEAQRLKTQVDFLQEEVNAFDRDRKESLSLREAAAMTAAAAGSVMVIAIACSMCLCMCTAGTEGVEAAREEGS